jgi:hypothetical protein
MIFNGKEVVFPAITKISFAKVFESLDRISGNANDSFAADHAGKLLELKRDFPILDEGFEDLKLLKKYEEPIRKLSGILFPEALLTNEIKVLVPPYNFMPIFATERFKKIVDNGGGSFTFELKEYNEKMLYIMGCVNILKAYYGYDLDPLSPSQVDIFDPGLGMNRTYRLTFNADLIEILPTKKSVDIKFQDYIDLLENFEDLDLWKKKFPPDSWIMRGIGIANLMDVTIDNSISGITSNLLIKTAESSQKIQDNIKRIFKIKDLQTGFFLYENDSFFTLHGGNSDGILLNRDEAKKSSDILCEFSYDHLVKEKKTLVLSDIDSIPDDDDSPFIQKLKSLNLKSYIISPLVHEDQLLGFVEMGSGQKHVLNNVSVKRMNHVLPIIAMSANRYKNERRNQIEAIIQRECTTIHSSVKWRFEEEAKDYLSRQYNNENPKFNDIVFRDVYPLFGQLDIKDSSAHRNDALKSDLQKQLDHVKKLLVSVYQKYTYPVYEELIFRIDSYRSEIKKGLLAGSEQKILNFLGSEIYPVFEHIRKQDNNLAKKVDKYELLLDPQLNTIYEKRKSFDDSVTRINQVLANYLDNKQEEAQAMFPHYFERYKTDGIEYNMYIGQSLTRNRTFDLMFLRNLQIWQLVVMCEMEREFRKVQKELDHKLEIASMILVYGTPLSVQFRMDEKKFDVEGAYNARYEIVKKRIDKAHIRGTDERVTQPGKIAIIFSKDQDGLDYRKYLTYLQAKGLIKNNIEEVELQSLQGITGLKALRVDVNYQSPSQPVKGYNLEEIMEAIEKAE